VFTHPTVQLSASNIKLPGVDDRVAGGLRQRCCGLMNLPPGRVGSGDGDTRAAAAATPRPAEHGAVAAAAMAAERGPAGGWYGDDTRL
jgi:hypothetical protein